MNYYNKIKNELINNELYKKVKDYSKNRSDLTTYYNVGKLLNDAGKHYGKSVIKNYSYRLKKEVGKKYNERTLRRMRQFYELFKNEKWSALPTELSWSHYSELLKLKDSNEINYYIDLSINQNLSYRELGKRIKNKEYERLDEKTKLKLIKQENKKIEDFIKDPILIKNKNNYDYVSEKLLQQLILEDIEAFMKELGNNFSFIASEYKIKIGNTYNYIDLLLYNIDFNCYVVIELKKAELKKEHIGQIEVYMNYIDKNLKRINQEKTIGIIICKKDNKYIIEYCSNPLIFSKRYVLTC